MTRKITYASARNKGKSFERMVAKALKGIGIDAQRVPMSGALSWLKGDVVEFNTIKPHLHECKNQQELCLNDWWRQACEQITNNEVPVLHFTSNYQQAYTVLTSLDFDELINSYEQFKPELTLDLVSIPPRKKFWKWVERSQKSKFNVFLYNCKDQELVVILFDFYLILRRQDIKRRAQEVIVQPAIA